jgi:hypothetical protein
VDGRKVASTGTLFLGAGIAVAGAILWRRDLVSPWWLLWAAYMVLVGALLRRRYRWSPELLAFMFLFGVGYAMFLLATRGTSGVVWSIVLAGTLGLLAVYPPLRRALRPPPLQE